MKDKIKKEVIMECVHSPLNLDSEYTILGHGILRMINLTIQKTNEFRDKRIEKRIKYWKSSKYDLVTNRHIILKELKSLLEDE